MSNNGQGEGRIIKECPFHRAPCHEERCVLWIPVTKTQVQRTGMRDATGREIVRQARIQSGECCLPALAEIMSSQRQTSMPMPIPSKPNNPLTS